MSFQTFLASDLPMDEVDNTHIQFLSVNEAINKGVNLSDMVLNTQVDRDKPGVILWAENEESLGEISLRRSDKAFLGCADSTLDTDLPCFSVLEWHYTEKRADELITYIRKHLTIANEIEIWNLWVGYEDKVPTIRKHSVSIEKLTSADFEGLFYSGQQRNDWQEYDCLSVKCNNRGIKQ
jgi:hypothetical protein